MERQHLPRCARTRTPRCARRRRNCHQFRRRRRWQTRPSLAGLRANAPARRRHEQRRLRRSGCRQSWRQRARRAARCARRRPSAMSCAAEGRDGAGKLLYIFVLFYFLPLCLIFSLAIAFYFSSYRSRCWRGSSAGGATRCKRCQKSSAAASRRTRSR